MTEAAVNSILVGDCIEQMQRLPAGLFHCCVTSPPYWNLRSYLPKGHADKAKEIGSEKTPDEFVATMVNVFREVRRVLRDDGVCWINLGDGYSAGGWECKRPNVVGNGSMAADERRTGAMPDLPDGNQLLMPHRVAMALQADGWILRSTVVWAKKSPMPESIAGVRWRQCRVKAGASERALAGSYHAESTDGREHGARNGKAFESQAQWQPCPGCEKCRETGGLVLRRGKWRCTTSHEYLFMLTKGAAYFCDGDAVQEPVSGTSHGQIAINHPKEIANAANGNGHANWRQYAQHQVESRNPRSVWTLSSEPYKGAHFATFPTELARRCIAASTSSAGCCPECGAAYAPVVSSERVATRPGLDNQIDPAGMANRDAQRHVAVTRVTGCLPTCKCGVGHPEPCRVFDPFGGSGTVAQVAHHLGRDYVVCELNPEYIPLIEARIQVVPRWKRSKPAKRPVPVIPGQKELFT